MRCPAKRVSAGGGVEEAGFGEHCAKKLLERMITPSNVPGRKSWRGTEKRRNAPD